MQNDELKKRIEDLEDFKKRAKEHIEYLEERINTLSYILVTKGIIPSAYFKNNKT